MTFGSTGHYFTLQALKKANLTERDVTLVNLKPTGMAPAYAANQIDAAWTWEPAAGKLNKLGATTLETMKSVGGYAAALWAEHGITAILLESDSALSFLGIVKY